jgi:hypothetical protein
VGEFNREPPFNGQYYVGKSKMAFVALARGVVQWSWSTE